MPEARHYPDGGSPEHPYGREETAIDSPGNRRDPWASTEEEDRLHAAMPELDHPTPGSGESSPPQVPQATPWAALVARIQSGEQSAMEELYRTFSRGIRYYLCRHLGSQELEDRIHDAYVIVVQAILAGSLRDPDRLMGFVRTVVRRQVAAHIEEAIQARKEHAEVELGTQVADHRMSPEDAAIGAQKVELMAQFLRECPDRDREILTRFYLYNQSQEQICEAMGLSDTQFRLLKSRAKMRLSESTRRQMARNNLQNVFVRKKSAGSH